MSGTKTEPGAPADPKNVQDLTQFVQTLLSQMQDNFQTMSDRILNRKNLIQRDLTLTHLTLDDMGTRIDDLEKNVADLMTQADIDEPEK